MKDSSLFRKYYSGNEKIDWNPHQRKFIINLLKNPQIYLEELRDYLNKGCCYTMHHSYRYQYIIKFFHQDIPLDEIKSRKFIWGYTMPWVKNSGDTLLNYDIEKILGKIITTESKVEKPLEGSKLLKYFINNIIQTHMRALFKLSAYSFEEEIKELSSHFTILSSEEVFGRGRYIWNEPQTMKIVLKAPDMLDNVRLVFLASAENGVLYSRDSIKKDAQEYIDRVQSIPFINAYLKMNQDAILDIYYFNNKGINNYNIESVNKNAKTWQKHDNYVESLKWYEKNNLKPGFDIKEAIRNSKLNDCGCNYRFDNGYIEKAIFFEIIDKNKSNSIWFLLPDNKVLLYHIEGNKVLDYNELKFNEDVKLPFACLLFDADGKTLSN
jgi:hypothetical protein